MLTSFLFFIAHPTCNVPSFATVINTKLGKFACYAKGDIVCNSIITTKTWENKVLHVLKKYMKQDTIFVDVGSNVGWYTFHMAQTHKVVAFEPFFKNLMLQDTTRCFNPLLANRIELNRIGLSDKIQRCNLYQIESINIGDTHTVCTDEERYSFKKNKYMRLATTKLDKLDDVASNDLLNAHKVMKIDIEGHEYSMLLGAENFFTMGTPPVAVYIEVFQLGENKPKVVDFFKTKGYSLMSLESESNYLFIRF